MVALGAAEAVRPARSADEGVARLVRRELLGEGEYRGGEGGAWHQSSLGGLEIIPGRIFNRRSRRKRADAMMVSLVTFPLASQMRLENSWPHWAVMGEVA